MRYDQVEDRAGVKLAAFAVAGLLPKYVIEATEAELIGDASSLRAGISRYPVHTKAATALSAIYYYHANPDDGARELDVELNLEAHARRFGIADDLQRIKAATAVEPTPFRNEDFLFEFEGPNGEIERRCPVVDRGSLRLAADMVVTKRANFVPVDQIHAAGKIAQRAAAMGLPLEEYHDRIHKYAGLAEVDQAGVRDAITTRADLLHHRAEDAAVLRQWGRELPAEVDGPTAAKYAVVMELLDQETGLDRLYGAGGLNHPLDTVFFPAMS